MPTESLKEINLKQNNLPIDKQIINDFFLTQEHSDHISLHYSRTRDICILNSKKGVKKSR